MTYITELRTAYGRAVFCVLDSSGATVCRTDKRATAAMLADLLNRYADAAATVRS